MSVPADPLYAVEPGKAIRLLAAKLKEDGRFQAPEWFGSVKGGPANERLPESAEQWFDRVAAILRTIAMRGPMGTQRLRNKFGGRQEHTRGRAHHRKAGGKAIRLAMQRLQAAGYVKNEPKGRVVTPAGRAFISKALSGQRKEQT
jgi:small subunit ribosomal protein S19e